MNIPFGKKFGSIPTHMSLVLRETKSANDENIKDGDPVKDNDGPGAGGGYDDKVEVNPSDDDGPGAGGGYDDSDEVKSDPSDSDGPGAGGGYDSDDFLDIVPTDADGPGAGGGYDGLSEFSSLGSIGSWSETSSESDEYFLSDVVKSATYTVTQTMPEESDWAIDMDFAPILLDVTFSDTDGAKTKDGENA